MCKIFPNLDNLDAYLKQSIWPGSAFTYKGKAFFVTG